MGIDSWYVGEPLAADELNTYAPLGVIAQGNRGSNKAFTTETGYLRIDGVELLDAKAYAVVAHNVRLSVSGTVAVSDHYKLTIRHDLTGAAATTSSTELGRAEMSVNASTAADDTFPPIIAWINPSADASASFLLTATRTAGAATVEVQADSPGIWLTVIDMGYAVADTGVDV